MTNRTLKKIYISQRFCELLSWCQGDEMHTVSEILMSSSDHEIWSGISATFYSESSLSKKSHQLKEALLLPSLWYETANEKEETYDSSPSNPINPELEDIVKRLKGRNYPVFLGLEEDEINESIKNASTVILITTECSSIVEGCRSIERKMPLFTDRIVVGVKFRDFPFNLASLAPLLQLVADRNKNASITWGMSVSPELKDAIEINLLLITIKTKRTMEECPNCGSDNAYCDGVENVCPDCGYTWPNPSIRKSDWG